MLLKYQNTFHEILNKEGIEVRPVSKETKDKIEKASEIALERIRYNNNVYSNASNIILGG